MGLALPWKARIASAPRDAAAAGLPRQAGKWGTRVEGSEHVSGGPLRAAVEAAGEDAALATACQAGDLRAYERLYALHGAKMKNLARNVLGSTVDAEDAVQECYLRALRHFDTFRGPAIKPWLFAILRNVCRSEFARRSGGLRCVDQDVDEVDKDGGAASPLWQEPQASPEAEVLQQRDAETIRRFVAELPQPFREAIVLREINDLSYREIADVIGIPVGTVMSRLARARSLLRKAWVSEEKT